jgi:hypothetical protein
MNIFITLLENVNKSRTSANNLSLKVYSYWYYTINNLTDQPESGHNSLESIWTILILGFSIKRSVRYFKAADTVSMHLPLLW